MKQLLFSTMKSFDTTILTRYKINLFAFAFIINFLFCLSPVYSENNNKTVSNSLGLINASASYYFDERDFNTVALSMASTKPIYGFDFWGFTDFHGSQNNTRAADASQSFSEYRLTHKSIGQQLNLTGLATQIEFNMSTPNGNDLMRLGAVYKHNLSLPWSDHHGWLQWRLFPYETDDDGGQFSVIYNIPLNERIGIKGFADYNVRESLNNRWVIEPELIYKINVRTALLLEYRYNEFEKFNPSLNGSGFAVGASIQL